MKDWQRDSSNIKTETVQFWMNGCMATAQMSKAQAVNAVNKGAAFVISEQAIGAIDKDGNKAS